MTAITAAWAAAATTAAAAVAVWILSKPRRQDRPGSRIALWTARLTGRDLPRAELRIRGYLIGGALALALLTWIATGIPMTAIAAAALVPAGRWLIRLGSAEERAIDRLEAIGEWTARLKDHVATGMGLQQAIVDSAEYAPEPIEPELRTLAARLDAGDRAEDALRAFADAIADRDCDAVVAQLILQIATPSRRLRRVLASLSASIAKDVARRREVDAERAGARTEIKVLTWGVLGFAIFALLVMRSWIAPFGHGVGQLYLAGLVAALALVLRWMAVLNRPPRHPRLLTTPGGDQ